MSDETTSPESPAVPRLNLARHRRAFEKYPNPIAWALPLLILAIGVAAIMQLLPDIGLKAGEFGKAFERVHRADLKKHADRAHPSARAIADSVAMGLEMPAGFPARVEESGGRILRASATKLAAGRQLHLVVRMPGAGARPVSVFAEHFLARNVDAFRRRDTPGGRIYVQSLPGSKAAPADSVIVWQEVGILATLVGAAPEDSLAAFASRMMTSAKAAHAADLTD